MVMVALASPAYIYSISGVQKPDSQYLFVMLILILACAFGYVLARVTSSCLTREITNVEPERLHLRATVLVCVACTAYAVYFAIAYLRGLRLPIAGAVLGGSPGAIYVSREALAPIAGITTLVELGGVAIAALVLTRPTLNRWERAATAAVILGSLARALLNAERLALIETLAPVVLALVGRRILRKRIHVSRAMLIGGAITSSAAVIGLFAAGEALRPSYQSREGRVGFGGYVRDRLFGYYTSAVINGDEYHELIRLRPAPRNTLDVFWSAPGISQLVTPTELFGFDPAQIFQTALRQGLNPELNTVALVPSLYAEWGALAACLLVCLLVYTLTLLWYRRLRVITVGNIPMLGVLLVASTESARYPYFCQARFLLAFAAATWFLSSTAGKDSYPSGRRSLSGSRSYTRTARSFDH